MIFQRTKPVAHGTWAQRSETSKWRFLAFSQQQVRVGPRRNCDKVRTGLDTYVVERLGCAGDEEYQGENAQESRGRWHALVTEEKASTQSFLRVAYATQTECCAIKPLMSCCGSSAWTVDNKTRKSRLRTEKLQKASRKLQREFLPEPGTSNAEQLALQIAH
jgi:hypothetical protein